MVKGAKVLITGAAGFVGFHMSRRLCADGYQVTGLDNLNDYYDVALKRDRVKLLEQDPSFRFVLLDLTNTDGVNDLFRKNEFDYVINLAAQAGVRFSIDHPHVYIESNVTGFLNILEGCRHSKVKHLLFASSGSVYGSNKKMPFAATDNADHPLSLYGATKKANELMAHSYASLYQLPVTGLRFFSAYGPYGRPDMALFVFTRAILEGKTIDVYNGGNMKRDFTYIDDITESIARLISRVPAPNPGWDYVHPDPSTSFAPYRIFNVGNNDPVLLSDFITIIEKKLNRRAVRNYMEMQPGDVHQSFADVAPLMKETGFKPATPIVVGVENFLDWYIDYYKVKL